MFGYIKLNTYSYCCRIISYDLETKTCMIEIGGNLLYDVPFDELQPVNGLKLPWDVVVN